MNVRKNLAVAGAALAMTAFMLSVASPASAASRDGVCDSGEFCYYYNSDNAGSVSDFTASLGDYGTTQPTCYEFKGAGNGKGICVKNNAASVWNRTSKTVRVYYNSDFAGAYQDFAAGAKGNLNATLKNYNASHELLSGATGCSTDGTNSKLPSTILVYRVSLGRVDRIDFKTYVKNVLPNEWITSWPKASLEAGAEAVKSYGWYWALHSTQKTSSGQCYDVRDDTGDQVYKPASAVASTSAARRGCVPRSASCASG
ncbi:peptidase inhibitor family I36 protein [Micromonospora sp. NPDC006766]|uniref:peptidase inhibitor family I36 protein n=1 Tax=Micromonospora sp. NPDC006766 TaxID=3154778 RepID=UPI0033ED9E5C